MDLEPKSLVLVVGAGASYEAGLPLGSELKVQIARLLDIRYDYNRISGDELVDAAFRAQARAAQLGNINPYLHACWRIRDAMPQAISIDNFIDAHRDNDLIAQCGKIGIARSILLAEAKSGLRVYSDRPAGIRFDQVEKTWFNAFFQLLTENCGKGQLHERFAKTAIVCFNYDRCIEHYLYHALSNYYELDHETTVEAIKGLEIYHPYGTVGNLPWLRRDNAVAFGEERPSAQTLIDVAAQIRTFTEGTDPEESSIVRIRSLMKEARRIAFLGFAFHRMNLQLMFPKGEATHRTSSVFATGLGISEPDSRVIVGELQELAGIQPVGVHVARDTTCAKLFADFRRSLSLVA